MSFDLDGTLYDAGRQQLKLWPWLLRHPRLLSAWPGVFAGLRGRRHPDLWAEAGRRLAARVGGDAAAARAVIEAALIEGWPERFGPRTPYPGVPGLLAALDRAGVPRVVISDYPGRAKLEAMGLGGWAAVIDCSALGALKPLPDGLLAAAGLLGLPPEAVVHVGDRIDTDGGMAEAAGALALIRGRDYPDVAALERLLLGAP